MLILDTNTISHLRDSRRWNPQFTAWEKTSNIQTCYISAISEFEIQNGIYQVHPKDPQFAESLQNWFDRSVKTQFHQRTIPIDSEICRVAANLARLPTRDIPDLLIAASALVHQLTVVTRNIRHFQDTGVKLLNPWQE